ncbi:Uncharacterised protein [Mycobacteroides abscessus subsp. abscessus]|nr:Uncharacterised protein [Mycobacteroides abscessus subsp. abscessus]SKV11888.1 Uncharacterised protein [Mycobacteroides abscessus subsp. abscessus]
MHRRSRSVYVRRPLCCAGELRTPCFSHHRSVDGATSYSAAASPMFTVGSAIAGLDIKLTSPLKLR